MTSHEPTLRLVAYDSPDGFRDWLYFWYRDLTRPGEVVRVSIRAAEVRPKDHPDQLGNIRAAARQAFLGGASEAYP